MPVQSETDSKNAEFWNEPCGTTTAQAWGADGTDAESIREFDRKFFAYYPYIDKHIDFSGLSNRRVLEIGLGYGSVSERLAGVSNYTGIDIADGPVDWVNYRLSQRGLSGTAVKGTALDLPFGDAAFDVVVAIGSLHHTGNLPKAIKEVRRVLRPGGRAVIMIYNASSYRQWLFFPKQTLEYVRRVRSGIIDPLAIDAEGRAVFDLNSSGDTAPETVAATKFSFERMLKKEFGSVTVRRENATHIGGLTAYVPRGVLLAMIGPTLGLDLYATAST